MRALPVLVLLLAVTGPAAGRSAKTTVTDLKLSVETVQDLGHWTGSVKVVHVDPGFVVAGTVTWVQRPGVIPRGSHQAFAVHSPAQLGLSNWTVGDEICLRLTRIDEGGQTSWRMSALKPDAGCDGRGA